MEEVPPDGGYVGEDPDAQHDDDAAIRRRVFHA
jgi:hypothetical protein